MRAHCAPPQSSYIQKLIIMNLTFFTYQLKIFRFFQILIAKNNFYIIKCPTYLNILVLLIVTWTSLDFNYVKPCLDLVQL